MTRTPAAARLPSSDSAASTQNLVKTTIHPTVSLRGSHNRQLHPNAPGVSTPTNSRYQHFLSAGDLQQRFGATAVAHMSVRAQTGSTMDDTGARLSSTEAVAVVQRALGVTFPGTGVLAGISSDSGYGDGPVGAIGLVP